MPGKGVIGLLWSSLNVWRPSKFSFRGFSSIIYTHLELWYHTDQICACQSSDRASSVNVWRLSNYFICTIFYQLHISVGNMVTMDELIEEILAEYEPRFIFYQPIPEDEERRLPRPLRPQRPFTDLDDQVPPSVRLPANQWVEILDDAKDECEVDGASAVFSTWRVERENPLDFGDIEIADGIHARAGRLALNALMTDVRATQLLVALPEGNFILRLKFLRENDDDWVGP